MRAWLLLPVVLFVGGCAASKGAEREVPAGPEQSWLRLPPGTERSPELDEAAAALCARGGDGILDGDLRQAAGLYDGQVAGLVRRGESRDVRRALEEDVPRLFEELGATHAGFAEGALPDGRFCGAVALARRKVEVLTELPAALAPKEPFPLRVRSKAPLQEAALYLLRPDGHVERRALAGKEELSDIVVPRAGEGRYVLELVVTGPDDAPEVALLWPFFVGVPKLPPSPNVLFPDEGHSDLALSYRAQALIERLRNVQLLEVLRISPTLEKVAKARAERLAKEGRLGHRLPDGKSAAEDVAKEGPAFRFAHLSELQAQGGTLEEAWTALLESPAHRYELVRPDVTHLGAAVVRSQDALGRPLVTLVLLLAKGMKERPPDELKAELYGKLNLARHRQSAAPLDARDGLEALCARQADAMAKAGRLDDRLLGHPLAKLAIDGDPSLESARVVVARLDDPLRLAPAEAALLPEMTHAGVGLSRGRRDGAWYVCILIASTRSE